MSIFTFIFKFKKKSLLISVQNIWIVCNITPNVVVLWSMHGRAGPGWWWYVLFPCRYSLPLERADILENYSAYGHHHLLSQVRILASKGDFAFLLGKLAFWSKYAYFLASKVIIKVLQLKQKKWNYFCRKVVTFCVDIFV